MIDCESQLLEQAMESSSEDDNEIIIITGAAVAVLRADDVTL